MCRWLLKRHWHDVWQHASLTLALGCSMQIAKSHKQR